MIEINRMFDVINPITPKTIDHEQINVHVPFANNVYPGIAYFDPANFYVSNNGYVNFSDAFLNFLGYTDYPDADSLVYKVNAALSGLDLHKDTTPIDNVHGIKDYIEPIKTNLENRIENINRNDRLQDTKIDSLQTSIITLENQVSGTSSVYSIGSFADLELALFNPDLEFFKIVEYDVDTVVSLNHLKIGDKIIVLSENTPSFMVIPKTYAFPGYIAEMYDGVTLEWENGYLEVLGKTIENINDGNGLRSLQAGFLCNANGENSFAGGHISSAHGTGSFVFGLGLVSEYDYQTSFGRYNENTDAAFVVGNGVSHNSRSNVFEIYDNGNVRIKCNDSFSSFSYGMGCMSGGGYGKFVVGNYNGLSSVDQIFVVGCGTSESDRKNAFAVCNYGSECYMILGETSLREIELKRIINFINKIE